LPSDGEPPFEFFVFGIVGLLPSLLVMEAEDAIGMNAITAKKTMPVIQNVMLMVWSM